MTSLLDLLLTDHERIERLLERLEIEDDAMPLRYLAAELCDLLAGHEAIEHELLFPVLRDGPAWDDEHADVNSLLEELRLLSVDGGAYHARLRLLIDELREHCLAEEDSVFPRVRELLSEEELERRGQQSVAVRRDSPKLLPG